MRVSGSIPRIHTSEVWKVKRGSMRQDMPTVAAFVDDLRAAFGRDYIDGAIRAGLQGRPVFWAQEGGHELGTKPRAMQHDEAAAAAQPKDTKR